MSTGLPDGSARCIGVTSAAMKALNLAAHQEMLLLIFMMHDLLPWRDEDRGMTLRDIREAMDDLGHPLTDRQVRYCLAQGAEALLMDVDRFEGRKQFWKRVDPRRLCDGFRRTLVQPLSSA